MAPSQAEIEALFGQLPDRRLHHRWVGVEGDILRAAFESILELGIGATSTYEIAARAGTYQGRLRHYFPERELIFRRLLELMYDTNEQQLADIAGSTYPPEIKVPLVLESGLKWVTQETDEFVVFIAYWSHALAVGGELLERCRELTAHFESTLASIIAEGQRTAVFKEGQSQLVAREFLALLWGLGLRYAMKPDPAGVEAMRRCLQAVTDPIPAT